MKETRKLNQIEVNRVDTDVSLAPVTRMTFAARYRGSKPQMLCSVGFSLFFWSVVSLLVLPGCTQPRSSFDDAKYAAMTQQQRAVMDRVFFNEFEVVDRGSNRYGSTAGSVERRQAEFEMWASSGYLPAWVAVRLQGNPDDGEAIKVLTKAADAGDISAMCMAQLLWHQYGKKPAIAANAVFKGKISAWTERGLAAGHGQCFANKLTQFHALNTVDVGSSTFDFNSAMPYLTEAAKQGYYRAHLFLFRRNSFYKKPDFNNLSEVSRALCWGRLAVQHSNHADFEAYLHKLKFDEQGRPSTNAAYRQGIYKRYDTELHSTEEKVVTPHECVEIELQKD